MRLLSQSPRRLRQFRSDSDAAVRASAAGTHNAQNFSGRNTPTSVMQTVTA